jgi:hypothetical protein
MNAQFSNLFVLQDLQDSGNTRKLADSDLHALRAVADWIANFVARPHKDLGRTGPVCPFVPRALERRTLWFAAESIAQHSAADLIQLINSYKRLLLSAQPTEGDDASYKAIVIAFSDLAADRTADYLGDARIQQLKRHAYEGDGVVIGEFHARNEGSAIRNAGFHPFKAPVPFLLMRPAVVSDWVFFLDNEDWLDLWARRFEGLAVRALADQLRRTNWRQQLQS